MSFSVAQLRVGAKTGLHMDRSTEEVFNDAGIKYVGDVSFSRKELVLERKSSKAFPFWSVVFVCSYKGL